MKISSDGVNFLKKIEGCSSKVKGRNIPLKQVELLDHNTIVYPYFCLTNIETIGYGYTISLLLERSLITQSELSEIRNIGITVGRCDSLFTSVVEIFTTKIKNTFPSVIFNQNQFDALISLTYNIGSLGSLLIEAIKNNHLDCDNIKKIWLKYCYSKGKISNSLLERRKREVDYYFKN